MHKRILFFLACFMLLASFNSNASDDVGRYQLFQGKYIFTDIHDNKSTVNTLLMIDTTTGHLFECRADQIEGRLINKEGAVFQQRGCQDFVHEIEIPDYRNKEK